jgi:hypothetical protein
MTDWLKFFAPHFRSHQEAAEFVEQCEAFNRDFTPPEQRKYPTPKIMMHQTVRLITLADKIGQLPNAHDPLSLVFLLACSECIAKLHDAFEDEGKSHAFVLDFFAKYVSEEDKQVLVEGIRPVGGEAFPVTTVVDLLYDIRCDVVHEGQYWGFSFPKDDCPMVNLHPRCDRGLPGVIVRLQMKELRDIIVRGCIRAVTSRLDRQQPPDILAPLDIMRRGVGRRNIG